MTETKTIGINSLITLGIVLVSMLTPTLFENPQYYCDSRPDLGLVQCDNFTKYVDPNGKCIRNDNTNLICRDGWKLVIDDTIFPEETEPPYIAINRTSQIGIYTEICTPQGCTEVKS